MLKMPKMPKMPKMRMAASFNKNLVISASIIPMFWVKIRMFKVKESIHRGDSVDRPHNTVHIVLTSSVSSHLP